MTQKQWIVLLLIVAVIRFGVAPLLEWQEALREDVVASKARLDKGLALQDYKSTFEENAQRLSESNQLALAMMFQPSANVQLSIQQQVQQSLAASNLVQERFDWLLDVPGGVHKYVAVVSVKGSLLDLMSWHLSFAEQAPWLYLSEWRIRRENNRDRDFMKFQGDLTIEAYVNTGGEQ